MMQSWSDALRLAGLQFTAIRLTGGGSQSAAWRQMIADVFELPVEVPEQSEGAAFGAALQAVWADDHAHGGNSDIVCVARDHVAVTAALSTRPDPAAVAAYSDHYGVFLQHLEATQQFYANRRGIGFT